MSNWTKALWLLWLLPAMGCAYSRPACQAIDLADKACEYIVVEYTDEDGRVQRAAVPKSELKAAAVRANTPNQPGYNDP